MLDYTTETNPGVSSAVKKFTEDHRVNSRGVSNIIDVRQIFAEKMNFEYDDNVKPDVCNPGLARRGLEISKQAGLIMPCEIAVYAGKGKTKVSLYKPTTAPGTVSSLPGHKKFKDLAIEAGLTKIIDMQQVIE